MKKLIFIIILFIVWSCDIQRIGTSFDKFSGNTTHTVSVSSKSKGLGLTSLNLKSHRVVGDNGDEYFLMTINYLGPFSIFMEKMTIKNLKTGWTLPLEWDLIDVNVNYIGNNLYTEFVVITLSKEIFVKILNQNQFTVRLSGSKGGGDFEFTPEMLINNKTFLDTKMK